MKGGVNKGMPAYLLKEDEWSDSKNFIFDYDRAKMVGPRQTVDQLVADGTNLYPSSINVSVCVGRSVPPPVNPFIAKPVVSPGVAVIGNGFAFAFQIVATNTPNSYAASGLPTGLTLNTSTGLITGTATGMTIGHVYSIPITATNAGGVGSATLTITVKQVCTINANAFVTFSYYLNSSYMISLDGAAYFTPTPTTNYKALNQIKMRFMPNPQYSTFAPNMTANLSFETGTATLVAGSQINEVGTVSVAGTAAYAQLNSPNIVFNAKGTNTSGDVTTVVGAYNRSYSLAGQVVTNSTSIAETFQTGGTLAAGSYQEIVLNF